MKSPLPIVLAAVLWASPYALSAQDGPDAFAQSDQAQQRSRPPLPTAPATDIPSAPPGAFRTAPWHSETSDVTPDGGTVYGRLANGMRYAIRHNDTPKDQVAVRLRIDFGSAAEADDERGLAHFIEHMAFNGTTNVAEGEMVKRLERLGLAFGAHTNASTGYTATTYTLTLPQPSEPLLDEALFLMRETARELLFEPAAVDAERGVVLEEMRVRENYARQSGRARDAFLMPDTYVATRYPIGTAEVIAEAPAARMKALYDRYYVPDRAAMVIVGPVDIADIEAKLVAHFADWRGTGAGLPALDRCAVDPSRPADAAIFSHPEITENIGITQYWPFARRADSIETRRERTLENIVVRLIGRRIQRASRAADAPFLSASVGWQDNICDMARATRVNLVAKDGQWRSALVAVEQLVRQAALHGFTQAERDEQTRNIMAALENSVRGRDTVSTGVYAARLLGAADDDSGVVTTPETDLALWRDIDDWLTLDRINAHVARWYGTLDRPLVFVTGKDVPNERVAELTAAVAESRAVELAPPVARDTAEFAYRDIGPAGAVVSDTIIGDLGIRTLVFDNGVRLNLKSTSFEDNRVRWSVIIDGGSATFAPDEALFGALLSSAFLRGGLVAHDYDSLQSLMAGTTVSPSFYDRSATLASSGSVAPGDLALQLQLVAAYLTAPGYRAEAIAAFRRPLAERYSRLHATPTGALGVELTKILFGDDPRFDFPDREAMEALDFPRLRQLLSPSLAGGAIEIGLVGDFDEEEAIAAVASTLGALPSRAERFTGRDRVEPRGWGVPPGRFTIAHRGEPDQLAWTRIWPTTDDSDLKLTLAMNLLADIFSIRLTEDLREEIGASYSGRAFSSMSNLYHDWGQFAVQTSGDVDRADEIEAVVGRIASELAGSAVEADLFQRAREPILKAYETRLTRNATWTGLVDEAQSRPRTLDRFRQSEALYRALTPADIQAAAARFLRPDTAYTARSVPADHPLAASAVNTADISSAPAALEKP